MRRRAPPPVRWRPSPRGRRRCVPTRRRRPPAEANRARPGGGVEAVRELHRPRRPPGGRRPRAHRRRSSSRRARRRRAPRRERRTPATARPRPPPTHGPLPAAATSATTSEGEERSAPRPCCVASRRVPHPAPPSRLPDSGLELDSEDSCDLRDLPRDRVRALLRLASEQVGLLRRELLARLLLRVDPVDEPRELLERGADPRALRRTGPARRAAARPCRRSGG